MPNETTIRATEFNPQTVTREDRLRDLVQQACQAIRFDQQHNPDCVLAWHLRFLEVADHVLGRGWKPPTTAQQS